MSGPPRPAVDKAPHDQPQQTSHDQHIRRYYRIEALHAKKYTARNVYQMHYNNQALGI